MAYVNAYIYILFFCSFVTKFASHYGNTWTVSAKYAKYFWKLLSEKKCALFTIDYKRKSLSGCVVRLPADNKEVKSGQYLRHHLSVISTSIALDEKEKEKERIFFFLTKKKKSLLSFQLVFSLRWQVSKITSWNNSISQNIIRRYQSDRIRSSYWFPTEQRIQL